VNKKSPLGSVRSCWLISAVSEQIFVSSYVGVSESKVPYFFCHQNTSHNEMPLSTIITYFIHDFFT